MNTATDTTSYRVIRITTNDFGKFNNGSESKIDEAVLWEGTDTVKLSEKYPPSEIMFADPLSHSEIEDGLIRTDYRFERQLEDGSWEKINDPRQRVTPMTEMEREIDDENRRLFPGDYITEDEDDYDDFEGTYSCDSCQDLGCHLCEPLETCRDCDMDFPVEELSQGICAGCMRVRAMELAILCVDCHSVEVDHEGDVCSLCQKWSNTGEPPQPDPLLEQLLAEEEARDRGEPTEDDLN